MFPRLHRTVHLPRRNGVATLTHRAQGQTCCEGDPPIYPQLPTATDTGHPTRSGGHKKGDTQADSRQEINKTSDMPAAAPASSRAQADAIADAANGGVPCKAWYDQHRVYVGRVDRSSDSECVRKSQSESTLSSESECVRTAMV